MLHQRDTVTTRMKLLESLRAASARKHLPPRTIECYESWVRQYLAFTRSRAGGQWRHPRELGGSDVKAFLDGQDGQTLHLLAGLNADQYAAEMRGQLASSE